MSDNEEKASAESPTFSFEVKRKKTKDTPETKSLLKHMIVILTKFSLVNSPTYVKSIKIKDRS